MTTTAGEETTTTRAPLNEPVVEQVPGTLEEPLRVKSVRIPEIAGIDTRVIYEQEERASLDGRDTFFWPDGNIGFTSAGDGLFRFFAANSVVTARTVGTFDDPGATVESANMRIEGASSEFAYLSGGPIYRDPGTGMLIMFYHAERYLDGFGAIFHAAIGMAASHDDGQSFQDLGIILETNAEPAPAARCCADMGGAPFVIHDGQFFLYFRDRMDDSGVLSDVQLAVATASVDDVVAAALAGSTSEWRKYNGATTEPGLGGRSKPLELGNPTTNWHSVSYNTALQRFVMVVSTHGVTIHPSDLYLVTSEDGYAWSPRVLLTSCDCELTYPSIISPDGNPLQTNDVFYVYYVTTPPDQEWRWHETQLHRMTVTLTGNMVTADHEWEFETDDGGWTALNGIDRFEVIEGALLIEPTGVDPYMESPSLGLSTHEFTTIEVRMTVDGNGTGQFFFSGSEVTGYQEAHSKRFPVQRSDEPITYTIDLSNVPGWDGLVSQIRFDPIDQAASIEVDYIRVLP